jgi:hypothetical protein
MRVGGVSSSNISCIFSLLYFHFRGAPCFKIAKTGVYIGVSGQNESSDTKINDIGAARCQVGSMARQGYLTAPWASCLPFCWPRWGPCALGLDYP